MKVQTVQNNQNFEGKIITVGSFSKRNFKNVFEAKKLLADRVLFAPFDMYIKESKVKNVLLATNKKFTNAQIVERPSASVGYVETYERLKNSVAKEIKKENFFEKVKYFLGIKKYIG